MPKKKAPGQRSPAKRSGPPAGGWLLYIVRCSDGTLYTGVTNDLRRRVDQHNSGTASRYTRGRRPVRLVYQERCRSKSSALKKEYGMKSLSRKEKEARIAGKALLARSPETLCISLLPGPTV